MYDPRRLCGTPVALVTLAAVLSLGSIALMPLVAGRPRWLPKVQSLPGASDFRRIGGRLAGVLRADRGRGRPADGEWLGLMLGSSTLNTLTSTRRLGLSRPGVGTCDGCDFLPPGPTSGPISGWPTSRPAPG